MDFFRGRPELKTRSEISKRLQVSGKFVTKCGSSHKLRRIAVFSVV
ncbi:hypothetical protein LEP1GSC040_3865 [Leptospira santarosai str. 2000030832]|nr:hypothetical protein LEP1GSC040_3865 [Leptospira santarosai str. 2000030832]